MSSCHTQVAKASDFMKGAALQEDLGCVSSTDLGQYNAGPIAETCYPGGNLQDPKDKFPIPTATRMTQPGRMKTSLVLQNKKENVGRA